MNLLRRIKNLYRLSEVEIKDGKLLSPLVKFEEKPIKMAEIIKMKNEETIINELLNEK